MTFTEMLQRRRESRHATVVKIFEATCVKLNFVHITNSKNVLSDDAAITKLGALCDFVEWLNYYN